MVEVTFSYTGRILADGAGVIEERSNLTDRIMETRINARDEAITRVLEDMGWASPNRCAQLVEALEQCVTSMIDSGYRADSVVIQAARAALAAYRKGGKE